MKITAQLLLFVFVSFLITPAIICLIEKDGDLSAFYSFSEEEKSQKEIKAIVNFEVKNTSMDLYQRNSKLILTQHINKHDKISCKIFIPPPKQV